MLDVSGYYCSPEELGFDDQSEFCLTAGFVQYGQSVPGLEASLSIVFLSIFVAKSHAAFLCT